MATHGTVRKMTDGQRGDIVATMAGAIPSNLTFEEAQAIIGNKGPFVAEIREAFGKPTAGNVFSITCAGAGIRTSELVHRGKYDWANSDITDARFPIEAHAPVSRTIELVDFDHDPSSEEVLAEFSRRGLERPTYEDALIFGIQHPEEQRRHPVVFMHEPVQVHGDRSVLVLDERGRGRNLGLGWVDDRWHRRCVFAAVRK